MSRPSRPLLATFIDADNVPSKYAEAILSEVATIGEPALRRVYGDWSSERLKGWSEKIVALGLVAHQQTANTAGKNASDIGLVIDAMDFLHAGRFDGFVLVSSDSDFTSLANRLREEGLEVYGIGERKTPEALRNVCNRFIFIENLAVDSRISRKADYEKEPPSMAKKLIFDAMSRMEQDNEWFHLGALGAAVVAMHPDFDPRTYGKGKLSELIASIDGFETKREGNVLFVRNVA